MSKTIARVVAGAPPPSVRTLREWIEWRKSEDKRMLDELEAQITAHAERQAGATEH